MDDETATSTTTDSLSPSVPAGTPEPPPGAPVPGFRRTAGLGDGGPGSAAGGDQDPPTTQRTTSSGAEFDPADPGGPNPWEGASSERTPLKAPKAWRSLIAEVLRGAGDTANERLAPAGSDLWLLDERDEQIADPLARIAARRVPDIGKTPDVADAVVAAFILVRYVAKQINIMTSLRRQFRDSRAARPTPAPAE